MDHDAVRSAVAPALELDGADAVDVVAGASATGLTRYANSQVIQNTVRDEVRVYIRVATEGRVASASTNQLDPDRLLEAARHALRAARASNPDPDFPGMPQPAEVGRPLSLDRYDEATAAATPSHRGKAVGALVAAVGDASSAGVYETSTHSYSVFSSNGVDCNDRYTRCVVTCLADNGEATGWGEASSHRMEDVPVEPVAKRAVGKANAGRGMRDAEAGTYHVVLEPAAAATLIDHLAYMGFGAKQVAEGESFLSGRAGQVVGAGNVTIGDDVMHPLSIGIGFDMEGVPKKRVAVIDKGKARGPVTDLRWSRKLGLDLTGHYSGSTEAGPFAFNVVMEAGDVADDDLVAGVSDGLLVTRFHYVNILDRPKTLLTGMTRDGTFRIRNGEKAEPVRNLRFTQGVLDALAATVAIGADARAFVPDYSSFGSTVAPALSIREFRFTSTTTH